MRAEVAGATSKLEALRLRAEEFEEELLIAPTVVLLLTASREKSRDQLDVKVAELEEVQSRLGKGEDEIIVMHEAQTRVAAELER